MPKMTSHSPLMALANVAFLATLVVGASSAGASVTVGTADSGNCYPFSCGPSDELTEYQQVYMNSAFPGVLSFDAVSFTQYPFTDGPIMDSATLHCILLSDVKRRYPRFSGDLAC